jgi:hypothetical protein
LKRLSASTSGLDLLDRFGKLVFGSGNNGHRHSGSRKSKRKRTAEASSSAGYQSCLTVRVLGHQRAFRRHERTCCRRQAGKT